MRTLASGGGALFPPDMDSTGEPRTLLSRIGHNFLTGLFLLLPIGITVAVLFFLMDLIGRYVQPLTEIIAEKADFLSRPQAAEGAGPELVDNNDEVGF